MFQCQQLWIDMQRLRPKAAVLFYSSSTTPERIDNRRGRKTSFSRLGSISAPECTTAWSCCILRTGPAELSELHHLQKNDHILKAISLPVYNHVWLRGETLHLCAERCFILQKKKIKPQTERGGSTSETVIAHASLIGQIEPSKRIFALSWSHTGENCWRRSYWNRMQ